MPQSALFIEPVGLAGAGKTTLARVLMERDRTIRLAPDLALRNVSQLPIVARHASLLARLNVVRPREWALRWEDAKAVMYLESWPDLLARPAMRDGTAVVFDHGPFFKLATLDAFGPGRLGSRSFERWWNAMLDRWAGTLDVVIWLTAPVALLLERINARDQRHAVKGRSEAEAGAFLARYERAYERVLAKLAAHGGPTLLHFDTGRMPIDRIADDLSTFCELNLAPRRTA